jgi:hypothetical protein
MATGEYSLNVIEYKGQKVLFKHFHVEIKINCGIFSGSSVEIQTRYVPNANHNHRWMRCTVCVS